MASFDEHIYQAKANLSFLQCVNNSIKNYFDWQVTICFYSAVHLINAHVVKSTGTHYRTHESIDNLINPHNILSTAKLDDSTYLSYQKLKNLSRRSRYLISQEIQKKEDRAFFTYEKHFKKAIHHLDQVLTFFIKSYKVSFNETHMVSSEIKQATIKNFKISKPS